MLGENHETSRDGPAAAHRLRSAAASDQSEVASELTLRAGKTGLLIGVQPSPAPRNIARMIQSAYESVVPMVLAWGRINDSEQTIGLVVGTGGKVERLRARLRASAEFERP
jgi:hypothetical protein